jgi:hypothetical protein
MRAGSSAAGSPDVVVGFGGFASFPGGLMGVAAGKPLVLHDANAVAGLATRVLAHGADRILLGFPQALKDAMQSVSSGSAIRFAIPCAHCLRRVFALPAAAGRCACWWWAAAWGRRASTTSCLQR